jgi:threonine/homoserine/homoserine lactone efflux protein
MRSNNFSDFDRSFNRMQKIIKWFIGTVFVLILASWVGYGYLAYTAAKAVSEQDTSHGIKPILEKIWCGEPGCLGK